MRVHVVPGVLALVLAFPAVSAGCMFTHSSAEGPGVIERAAAERILPGVTTRGQVIAAFGPPLSVVRAGTPAASEGAGAGALELFVARGESVTGRCVYVYGTPTASRNAGVVLLVAAQSTTTHQNRLWILVDDATGTVVDRIYRED